MITKLERLTTVLRWMAYGVPLEHLSAGDRALLRWHRQVQRWIARETAEQRRLERAVLRSLRAYQREHRARVLAARRAEYAAWDPAMQHRGRSIDCPACQPGARARRALPA